MATNTTFATLQSDMTTYLERGGSQTTDPTVFAQLPRLINQAERRLADLLKLLGMKEVLTGVPPNGLQSQNPVLAKPDRWRKTVSFCYGTGPNNLNSRQFLLPRDYSFVTAYWPDRTQTAPPIYYADYDLTHWLIGPTPDQPYPFEVVAYMQPVLLDDVNTTNFWTIYTPALLLYSALLEAEPFLKDDPRLQVWGQMQQAEIQSLNTQDLQRMMDQVAERSTV